jgi:hypothetical protein
MTFTPLKAVRAYCLWCCLGSSPEVRICPSEKCALWAYRHGHNPKRAKTGLTATYTVDDKSTARRAIFARCKDCLQKSSGECGCPECPLHEVRYRDKARLASGTRTGRPISGAAARSRLGSQASTMRAGSATVGGIQRRGT